MATWMASWPPRSPPEQAQRAARRAHRRAETRATYRNAPAPSSIKLDGDRRARERCPPRRLGSGHSYHIVVQSGIGGPQGRRGWVSSMRVLLIIAVLLLVVVSGAGFLQAVEPFRPYLSEATLALAILTAVAVFLQPRRTAQPRKPAAEPARPAPPPQTQAGRADADIVHFRARLQEKGRLVDFVMDDINAYSDAQVGAAARVVHAGCKGVLQEHFRINPVRTEQEGSTVQVPAGYSAAEYRLVGRI